MVQKELSEFEQQLVAMGISAATAFSLPKSVGAMYGLAFARAQPMAMDDFVERLGISKGSASNGLKFLQRIGAVKAVYVSGDRRTLYEPEISLRRLFIGILNENVAPHLKNSGEQVKRLKAQMKEVPETDREVLGRRLEAIEAWRKKGRLFLPVFEKFLSGPLREKSKEKILK